MKIQYLSLLFLLFSCSKNQEPIVQNQTGNQNHELIAYGKDLIVSTSKYFGPKGSISQTSNGMNCTNCHLEAGTKDYGNNYKAVFSGYPKFRERSGTKESLEKRINDCFERSLNGSPLKKGKELEAMKAYINYAGENIPKNEASETSGIPKLNLLNRAANPEKGALVYEKNCVQCHGKNGEGSLASGNSGNYFLYPPLWGKDSFNVSAGLYRIRNLSGFIRFNMPDNVATYQKPVLSEEEAWDVAAYIISRPHPEKFFKEDWPNLKTKPADYAFKPFADPFSEERHKYGPFQDILASRKK